MQRYRIVDHYDFPVGIVVELLMETPLYDLQDLPNVSTNETIEERDEGTKKYIKVKWNVHGQIPKAAQKIISPETLTFLEDSVWDRETLVYSTKVIPHFFKKQVNCRHKLEFFEAGNKTKRVLSGFFEIKIPVIGQLVEPVILKYLKQNSKEDFEMGSKALKQYVAKNGLPDSLKEKYPEFDKK